MAIGVALGTWRELRAVSVDGEAVELARTAGGDEARRGAVAAHMRRIPRHVAVSIAVVMAKHRAIGRGVRGPVVARMIETIGKGATVGVRTRQHVVLIGHVAEAVDYRALLGH